MLKKTLRSVAPAQAKTLADETRGVSHDQLAILLTALGDKQFTSRDQLTAFVGLDVRPRQSGAWQGKQRLSKRGNAYLRKVLFQIAWGLKQNNPTYQAYYHRLFKEGGKHYYTCLIAVARKFLRFLFAVYWQAPVPV